MLEICIHYHKRISLSFNCYLLLSIITYIFSVQMKISFPFTRNQGKAVVHERRLFSFTYRHILLQTPVNNGYGIPGDHDQNCSLLCYTDTYQKLSLAYFLITLANTLHKISQTHLL